MKEVLNGYKKVTNEIMCTSDITNEKYGVGIVHLKYNLNKMSVKRNIQVLLVHSHKMRIYIRT